MFCTTICGYGWSTQSSVDHAPAQVSEYRIRRLPPPLSVISPPPSTTTRRRVLITLAVVVITIVTGLGPQLKAMMPPAATSRTTAAGVQLAGVPLPITWLGCLASTARPAAGTWKCPLGLPKSGTTDACMVRTAAVVECAARADEASISPYPTVTAPTSTTAPTSNANGIAHNNPSTAWRRDTGMPRTDGVTVASTPRASASGH